MYVNFTNATKDENNGYDVLISGADKNMYNPKKVENRIENGIYQYVVTQENEGSDKLRFWRGNDSTLWNFSVVLSFEDYLIVQSAVSELEIAYKNNDTKYSVTDNLSLVTELNGATIEWSSSNEDVITDEGVVNRPCNESMKVILTANVKSNSYFETKQFELYVIKNKYVNYNTDYIEDIDSFEMLYLYNDGNVDNLEVYINDDGYIEYIMGSFSDIVVESPEEAILSLYTIKSLMGCKSPKDELRWVSTNKDNYGTAFRFEQVYYDIPIYGTSIVVSTNQLGYTSSLQSSFVSDLNISTAPKLSEIEAKQKVMEYGYRDADVEKLYVYMDNSIPKLAWNVYAKGADGSQYNILIDASSGEVLFENLNSLNEFEFGSTIGTGISELGNREQFSVAYRTVGTGTYKFTEFKLRDAARNIEVYDFEGSKDNHLDSDKVIVKPSNTWEPDEVSAMANVSKAYDFYLNNFGRKGFDDKNSKIPVIIHDANEFDNSGYNPTNGALNFGSGGSYIFSGAAALDTVGHEFTHGVIRYTTSLHLNRTDEPGAINEGYADIFGYFIEGDDGSSEFYSVRINVLAAANDMRMSAEEIQIIKAAFDKVGIEESIKVDIEGTNILAGKVVEADTDMTLGNNLPLGDVSISIVRTGVNIFDSDYLMASKHTKTSNDGTFYINNIVPGTYKLTIKKAGYHTTTQIISLTTTKLNNYCRIPKPVTGTI